MFVLLIVLIAALLVPGGVDGQQPETLSLRGEPLYPPKLSKAARASADAELSRAHAAYTANPSAVSGILALSRAHLALGRIGDALVVLTHGIEANPEAPELFLERGRGYIVYRKFGVAARDLSKAAAKLPDARCSLGFAQYVAGDYERARASYADCAEAGVFGYLTLRRTGATAPRPVPDGPIPPSSSPIRFPGTVAKGRLDAPEPLSASYLTAIELLLDGRTDQARERLKKIVERNRNDWMQPAYIAAEADYSRLEKPKRGK